MNVSGISQGADTTREKYLPELHTGLFRASSVLNNPALPRRAGSLSSHLVRFGFCSGFFHLLSVWVETALDFALGPGKTVESEPCLVPEKYPHQTPAPDGDENHGKTPAAARQLAQES